MTRVDGGTGNALQGQLEEKTLANLLQFLSLDQATGALQLRNNRGEQGAIFFENGKVVHIASKQAVGVTALSVLLTWTSGRFRFKPQATSPNHTVRLSLDSLLLEASYQADQTKRSSAEHLSPDSVLVPRTSSQTQEQGTVAMTLRSIHLLRHFDGQRSVAKIAADLGEPVQDILEVATELLKQSLLESATEPTVAPAFIDDVTNFMIEKMGPIGEIIVEDTLYDLDSADSLSRRMVPEFVSELRTQLSREEWQAEFDRLVDRLYETYQL
ncbi:MAG: DUF4388 domain-containing protein [Trueperaceae bacterium]|nr:DUF4388 domain-containing protein [Trueperaceae bacterium]